MAQPIPDLASVRLELIYAALCCAQEHRSIFSKPLLCLQGSQLLAIMDR